MALRQSGAETKSEAIDFLIDRGYLHSDEVYDSAVANAMGDFVGISSYNPEEDEEFEAPVGTKHSALDEVHQRLRESGKKRRQQKIAKARRMKQRKFEGHHGHHHAAEMEMTPDIMDYPGLPVVPDSYGTNSALDSGNGVPQWYGSAESDVYYSVHLETLDGDTVWGGEYYLADYQNEKGLLEEAEFDLNYAEPAWKVATITKNGKVVKKIEYEAESFEARAESANPTGGATGDQIVSWEHNGLSSPSGPPSDIFWSESTEGIQINFSGAEVMRLTKHFGISKERLEKIMKSAIKDELETTQQGSYASFFRKYPNAYNDDLSNIELDAEGYGDISRYITIDFTWDYSGEHEDLVSDDEYSITEQIKDLVESEVHSGEYGGNGSYSYTVEIEDDKGDITEEDVDIDYSWR